MWKVVVTEIQDAHALEPTTVPPGAFFVNTERFSRTIENLDLQALVDTIDRMQSLRGCRQEERPVSGQKAFRRAGPLRLTGLRDVHGVNLEPARLRASAAPLLSQTDP